MQQDKSNKNRILKVNNKPTMSKTRQLQNDYQSKIRVKSVSLPGSFGNKDAVTSSTYKLNNESVSSKYFPKKEYFYCDNNTELWHENKMHLMLEKNIFQRKEKSTDKVNKSIFNDVCNCHLT